MKNANGSRIDEIEIRLAEQEKTIADLNDVITAQWRKIDALERQLARLADDIQSLGPAEAPANQRPPHY